MGNVSEDTLKLVRESQAVAMPDDLKRAYEISSKLVAYDLEGPAKTLYPVLTPLRNRIPRATRGTGTATHWKAVTGINTSNVFPGASEGQRSAYIAQTVAEYTARYAKIGLENYFTFEAEEAGEGFDDVRSRTTTGLLEAVMIEEEHLDLGGNGTYGVALGTPVTPTLADSSTGGAIPQTTAVYVSVVALTHYGWRYTTVAGGCLGQFSRTNADASTDTINGGNSKISAAANITTATDGLSTHSILASTTAIAGAVAYAWYWGATAGAAQVIGAITTINSVKITTAAGTGTQAANDAKVATADYSKDALVYDGLISIIAGAAHTDGGSAPAGGVCVPNATGTPGTGTALTSDGSGGCNEIETDLDTFYTTYKLSPQIMFVGGTVLKHLSKIVIQGTGTGTSPTITLNITPTPAGVMTNQILTAGMVVGSYYNKQGGGGGSIIQIIHHPFMAPGMILYYSERIPYPLSNVSNILQIKPRREYYQQDWPVVTAKYEFGVYVTQVLQCYFPPAFGMRYNIADS